MLLIDTLSNDIGILCARHPVLNLNNWTERAVTYVKPFVLYTICNILHLYKLFGNENRSFYEKYPLIN